MTQHRGNFLNKCSYIHDNYEAIPFVIPQFKLILSVFALLISRLVVTYEKLFTGDRLFGDL